MSDPTEAQPTASSPTAALIPEEHVRAIRTLAHDLSNALEIIVQTSYLLGTSNLQQPASEWHRLLEQGVQKAVNQNQNLRDYIKANGDANGFTNPAR